MEASASDKGTDEKDAPRRGTKDVSSTGKTRILIIIHAIAGAAAGFFLGSLGGNYIGGACGAGIGVVFLYAFSASMNRSGNFKNVGLHVSNYLYTAILMAIWSLAAANMSALTPYGTMQGVRFGLQGGAMLGMLSVVYTFTLQNKFGYILVGSGIGAGAGAGIGALVGWAFGAASGTVMPQVRFFSGAGLFIGVFMFPFLFVLEDNSKRQKLKRYIVYVAIAAGAITGLVSFWLTGDFPFHNLFVSFYIIVLVTVAGNFVLFAGDYRRKEFPYMYGDW